MSNGSGLREVSRHAVRTRIAEVAEDLFVCHGYEATTVDEIAEAVGMSQRTFFRYFASKEDAALDEFERQSDAFLARLEGRPLSEPEWESLRRVFDVMVEHCADTDRRRRATALLKVIHGSPALLAAYLQKVDRMQQRLLEELRARSERSGATVEEPVLRALVGAAFACLHSVLETTAQRSSNAVAIAEDLDRVMSALRPARSPVIPVAR